MALFYRSESTEKQFEYLRFTIRLVTDLGTDPDLITLVWSCVVPINQTKAVFIFFIWASETSFVMAWTWITSSVSGGGDIIQKRNVMKNKINTDKQQQNNKKNTCFFFFSLPCDFLQNLCVNVQVGLCPRRMSNQSRDWGTTLWRMTETLP